MNWKKSLFVVALTGMTVLGVAGCNNVETLPATESPVPSSGQSAAIEKQPSLPAENGTMPMPPEGGVPGERPTAPAIDLAIAATKLGVTEQQLTEALGDTTQGPIDMKAVAEKLGVSEESLREALGFSAGGPPQGGPPPDNASPPPIQGE